MWKILDDSISSYNGEGKPPAPSEFYQSKDRHEKEYEVLRALTLKENATKYTQREWA